MFESSLVDLGDKKKKLRSRWVSLPVAVLLHLVLAVSVGFAAYWQVGNVPEPSAVNVVFLVPPDLPAPGPASSAPPAAPEQQEPVRAQAPVVTPEQSTQPQDVPEDIPVAQTPVPVVVLTGPSNGTGEGNSTFPGVGPGVAGSIGTGGGCEGLGCGSGPVSPMPVAAAASAAPLTVGGAVTRPEPIFTVPPVYTELARRARVQGTVIVQAIIDEQGRVTDVQIIKPLTMGLDRSAVEAVQKWRFKPATLHGRAVKVYYKLTVRFEVQ
jgi:protein TonB